MVKSKLNTCPATDGSATFVVYNTKSAVFATILTGTHTLRAISLMIWFY
jgi:hypothetical protein